MGQARAYRCTAAQLRSDCDAKTVISKCLSVSTGLPAIVPNMRPAIVAGMMFMIGTGPPSQPTTAIVWGTLSGGLQCGLSNMPENGSSNEVQVTIKNVGSRNLTFLISDLMKLRQSLVDVDQTGNAKRHWSSMYSGGRPVTVMLSPGQSNAYRP